MLFLVGTLIAQEVVLDHILKATVISEQSQLDDMITKLLPFHGLVTIDIYFFKEIDKCDC